MTYRPTFDPMADIIDMREVIDYRDGLDPDVDPTDADEMAAVTAFIDSLESDTGYSADDVASDEPTIIADRYFIDYAQQLADDIGAVDADAGWPTRCIDWKKAAEELQEDYTTFDHDGRAYWFRAF
mgnify:CR=1 FL=1